MYLALHFLVPSLALPSVRYNKPPSLPRGWYLVRPSAHLERGDLRLSCVPETWGRWALQRKALERGACAGGFMEVGKLVVGTRGDTVDIEPAGISINGVLLPQTEPQRHDRRGNVLGKTPEYGRYYLGPGECVLTSTFYQWSFDSRYFGPVICSAPHLLIEPLGSASQDSLRRMKRRLGLH